MHTVNLLLSKGAFILGWGGVPRDTLVLQVGFLCQLLQLLCRLRYALQLSKLLHHLQTCMKLQSLAACMYMLPLLLSAALMLLVGLPPAYCLAATSTEQQ